MVHCVRYSVGERCAWFAGIAAAALMAASTAQAQATYSLDIAPGGLEPALLSLAAQSKQQIFFHRTLVAGRRAPAVRGVLTPEQALAQMLAGSGLRARRVNPELVVVERAPTQHAAPEGEARGERPFGDSASIPLDSSAAVEGAPPATMPEPTTIEAVVVTGSNIRGGRTASPVVRLGPDDLARTGRTTVADALRTLPANFGGGASDGAAASGADRGGRNPGFGTALNLRGLGNNATLVLVNGRRIAGSGSFGDFADISSIPSAAVARVDVLLDGASAIYGADAVGGVVNIILRDDFEGAETRILGGVGTAGEPAEGQFSQVIGQRWSGGGVLLAYELQRRDFLQGDDRSFAANADLRRFGGTDWRLTTSFPGNVLRADPSTGALVPGWAIPAGQNGVDLRPSDFLAGTVNLQNQRQGVDLLPRQTLNAVYLAADQSVGTRLRLSADARFSSRRFKFHSAPPISNLNVTRANPFFVSPNGSAAHFIGYSFTGHLPSAQQAGEIETLALSLGAELKLFGDWEAEAYVSRGQEIAEIRQRGAINSLFLNEALGTTADRADTAYNAARDGYFNPFAGVLGANSATVLGFIGSGNTFQRTRTRVTTANLHADGTLLDLRGGPLQLALGGQVRRETLVRRGFNWVSTVAPSPLAGADVGRTVSAGFAEARVPIFGDGNRRPGFERLEFSLAGRVEHYQDVGATANPKFGLIWAPTPSLVIRGTYGRSFRAPALREVTDSPVYAPTLLTLGTGRVRSLILQGGNPDLDPERATSWTVGADWRPQHWPGLTLSATYFEVRFRDRIAQPVQQNLSRALTDPTLAPFVARISPATSAEDLARISAFLNSPFLSTLNGVFPPEAYGAIVDSRFVNTAALTVRGLDVNASYEFDLGGGRLGLSAAGTYLFDYAQQITPTSPVVDQVNVVNFPVRFRGRAGVDWTRGRLTSSAFLNYTSAYRDGQGRRIDAHPTVDLQWRLAAAERGLAKGVELVLSARNVFNRDPPFYDNPAGVAYDGANADPIGRYVSLQLTRAW